MPKPIYLDYAATTPVDPKVAEAMMACLTLTGNFANPASRSHQLGWLAEQAVESARGQVAELLGADSREIIWTSGATEADNLALKGVALNPANHKRHVITSKIEHKAVLDSCAALEQHGYEVSYLSPDSQGQIQPEQVAQALRDDTALVSIMMVNNEVGTINDVQAIGAVCRDNGVLFHVDAAQAAGKVAIDLSQLPVDMMSVCAHKIYGPKGVGALYVRKSIQAQLQAQIHGGGHEQGLRSGTLPTHQLVGMGEAFELAGKSMAKDRQHNGVLRELFCQGIKAVPNASVNGHPTDCVAGIVNVSFAGCEGETLLMALKGLAISSGSACNSASMAPSYVLKAMGASDERALSSLRFSWGRFTTEGDISKAVALVTQVVERLG